MNRYRLSLYAIGIVLGAAVVWSQTTPSSLIPDLTRITVDGLPVEPNTLIRDTRPLTESTVVKLVLHWQGAEPTTLSIRGITMEVNTVETASGLPFRCMKVDAKDWAGGQPCMFHYHFVPHKRGDTNSSGDINTIDLAKAKANQCPAIITQDQIDCDIDRDGDVDSDDMAGIKLEIGK